MLPDFILNLSPLIKLAIVLASIVGLMRVKVPMGAALVAGSVLIAFLFPMGIGEYGSALAGGIFSQQAIFLAFIVGGLLVFSGALNESGQIDRIKDAIKQGERGTVEHRTRKFVVIRLSDRAVRLHKDIHAPIIKALIA